jgi:hypothetical protein
METILRLLPLLHSITLHESSRHQIPTRKYLILWASSFDLVHDGKI